VAVGLRKFVCKKSWKINKRRNGKSIQIGPYYDLEEAKKR